MCIQNFSGKTEESKTVNDFTSCLQPCVIYTSKEVFMIVILDSLTYRIIGFTP